MENENLTGMEMNDAVNEGSKGMAVTALVFGIVSMVCCCVGFPFAIVGLILSVIVLAKHKNGKGLAIGGLITSVITLIVSIISFIIAGPYISNIIDYSVNAVQYAEEYEEDGTLPPLYEQMIDNGLMDEKTAEQSMDQVVKQYEKQLNKSGR